MATEPCFRGFRPHPLQASTLGSLEALLLYLSTHEPPVPVASVGLGPLHKKDITTASVMLEHKREFATVLAFDVKVTAEARAAAEELGVRIFTADIIYHLTDQFDAYIKEHLAAKVRRARGGRRCFPV
jgi:translation initiation factor 5B